MHDHGLVILQHAAAESLTPSSIQSPFISGRQQLDAPLAYLLQAKQIQHFQPLLI